MLRWRTSFVKHLQFLGSQGGAWSDTLRPVNTFSRILLLPASQANLPQIACLGRDFNTSPDEACCSSAFPRLTIAFNS